MRKLYMKSDDLIVDIQKIPLERENIEKNLQLLSRHSDYIEGTNNIRDRSLKLLIDAAIPYIRKQINMLLKHLGDDADIIAWISRGLMELFFTLRYMRTSSKRYEEVIKEQLKDLKEIEDVIYPNGSPSADDPEEMTRFYADMTRLWKAMQQYGVERDDLRRPNQVKQYAEGANLLDDYNLYWRIHSKYVHPTSYLLFGKKSLVFGNDARLFFWVMAQYYAAWNLRDLHKMLKDAQAKLQT